MWYLNPGSDEPQDFPLRLWWIDESVSCSIAQCNGEGGVVARTSSPSELGAQSKDTADEDRS